MQNLTLNTLHTGLSTASITLNICHVSLPPLHDGTHLNATLLEITAVTIKSRHYMFPSFHHAH